MQPKTKLQKRVWELFSTLKPITSRQEKWGVELYKHFAFFNKQGNICAYCGEFMGDTLVCPHCKGEHKAKADNNQMRVSYTTFNTTECVKEFQVVRTFWVRHEYRKGCKVKRDITEVCQSWIDEQGKETRVAKGKVPMTRQWNLWSEMEIRPTNESPYGYYADSLHKESQNTYTYPYSKSLHPILKRNGMTSAMVVDKTRCLPVEFFRLLFTDNKTETLLKTGYYKLIGERFMSNYWKQIKLAIRHKYHIEDYSIWTDTIDLMERFGMDTHNPQYVCSPNIRELHDRLVAKRERQEVQEKIQRDMNRLMNNEQAKAYYIQSKGKYFGICITDQELTIEVLKSVEEFIEEGANMHHCVSVNEYYKKDNSLILSARVNGERVETIEVDLQRFKIVQSRGKYNSTTKYHDRIIDLIESNMKQIKAIKTKAKQVA